MKSVVSFELSGVLSSVSGRFLSFLMIVFSGVCSAAIALADNPVLPAGSVPATAAGAAPQAPGIGGMILPFAAMFGVIYFLMIRPQKKKMQQQQEMLSTLKQGDEIVTNSGILGKITGTTDKVVTLEIAEQVRIKMLKSQVSQVVKGQIKDLTL